MTKLTKERLNELLVISTLVRNVALLMILVVVSAFMLYVMLSPDDPVPAARDTRGGIPVTDSREVRQVGS